MTVSLVELELLPFPMLDTFNTAITGVGTQLFGTPSKRLRDVSTPSVKLLWFT